VGSGAGGMSDVAARFRRSKLEPRMISRHGDVRAKKGLRTAYLQIRGQQREE
jgi:hypothetical protein